LSERQNHGFVKRLQKLGNGMQGAECCAKRAKARVPVVVRQFKVVVTEFDASSRMISITSSVSHKECSLIV